MNDFNDNTSTRRVSPLALAAVAMIAVLIGASIYILSTRSEVRTAGAPATDDVPADIPTAPDVDYALDAAFGDSLRLVGANVAGDETSTTIDLIWYADEGLAESPAAFVQAIGLDGSMAAQSDTTPDLAGQSGQFVTDSHVLTIPLEQIASLDIGLYDQTSGERVALEDGSDHASITLTEVMVLEPTIEPTPDMAVGPGGFVENAIDISTLPEYTVSGGGGGGGGGGGCPIVDETQTVALLDMTGDWKMLCLYDLPDLTPGARFTATLSGPSGQTYSETYTVEAGTPPTLIGDHAPADNPAAEHGFIASDDPRTPAMIPLYFQAAQEFGTWQVQAGPDGAVPFASGSIEIATNEPIYSVTALDDPLDPFVQPLYRAYQAGDQVLFAGRGLNAGQGMILALYTADLTRSTNTAVVMVAQYATQITVGEDTTYRAEFVVGTETPAVYYNAVFDPAPGEFMPAPFGLLVGGQ